MVSRNGKQDVNEAALAAREVGARLNDYDFLGDPINVRSIPDDWDPSAVGLKRLREGKQQFSLDQVAPGFVLPAEDIDG